MIRQSHVLFDRKESKEDDNEVELGLDNKLE